MRGTCSQHAGAAVAADPRVLRGSPHSFERKRVPPLFLLSAPMVGGRDWSSGGRARDARAARARRPGDAARAAARTERAALTSFDRPPIVIKRTFVRGVSPWDVSHSAQIGWLHGMQGRGTHLLWLFYAEWSVIRYAAKRPAYLPKLSVHIVGRVVCLCVYPALFVGSETKRIRAPLP